MVEIRNDFCYDVAVTSPCKTGKSHRDHEATAAGLHEALSRNLAELKGKSGETLVEERYQKFRKMSRFVE